MDILENLIKDIKNLVITHDAIETLREADITLITKDMDLLKAKYSASEKKLRDDVAAQEEKSKLQAESSISIINEDIKKLQYWYNNTGFIGTRMAFEEKQASATVSFKPDMKRLDHIHSDFIFDPFWLKGANIVTLGSYKRKLLNSFYASCQAGIAWYKEQIAEILKNRETEKKCREQKLVKDIQTLKNKLSQAIVPLEQKLAHQNAIHNDSILKTVCNSAETEKLYKKLGTLSVEWGLTKNVWDNYTAMSQTPKQICLGYARVPVTFSDFTANSMKKTKLGTFYSEKSGILVPFCVLFNSNIAIEYSEEIRSDVVNGIQGLLTRFIRSMPIKSFEVSFIDPIGRGGSLGKLIKLSETEPHNCPLFHVPVATKSEIAEQLKKIVDHIGNISKKLAYIGTNATIEDYNASHPGKIKYQIVIIEDFTEGLDPSFIDYLKVITGEAAQKAGVIAIICTNKKFMPKERFNDFYKEYVKGSVYIREENGEMRCNYKGTNLKVKLVDASKASDVYISQVYSEYVKKLELDNSAKRFYGDEKPIAFKDATKPLYIPFAVDGETNKIVEMELGGNTTSFAMITGTQGSGKSTTLHALIVGLMANYHPDDVELWLVDYKMTEFSTMYRDKRLPHVKYLGIENSPEFTFGILDKVKEEFERRGKLLEENGFKDIKSYMLARKKQLANHESNILPLLPRIVLIIDEVSNLANHINERPEYKEFFEHMIRTYRAWGLCAVFADQYPIANNHGITDDAQDLIMTRMAMAHNLQHMKSTLLLSSKDYSDKLINDMSNMSSGDIIYKYKFEKDDWRTETIIKKYKSVYLQENEIAEILERLNTQLTDGTYVDKHLKTIRNSERTNRNSVQIKDFAMQFPLSSTENIGMYLGTPTSFEECFRFELSCHTTNNVLVVASNRDMNYSVVINSIRSFQSYKGNKTIVLAHPKNKLYKTYKEELQKIPAKNEDVIIVDDFESTCACLDKYNEYVVKREDAEKTLIIFLGLDEWCEDFTAEAGNVANISEWSSSTTKNTIVDPEGNSIPLQSQIDQIAFLDAWLAEEENEFSEVTIPEEVPKLEVKRISLDARSCIANLLRIGSRYNIYLMATFESTIDVARLPKEIKVENFGHKIVGAIQKNDAYSINFPVPSLSVFSNKQIAESNLMYSNGISEPKRFRPYLNTQGM